MDILLLNARTTEPSVICLNYKILDSFMKSTDEEMMVNSSSVYIGYDTHWWNKIDDSIKLSNCSTDDYCLIAESYSLRYEQLQPYSKMYLNKHGNYLDAKILFNDCILFQTDSINYPQLVRETSKIYNFR